MTTDYESLEITRIRSEYLRRRRKIAPDFYSLRRPVNQFCRFQTIRACLHALVGEGMLPLTGRVVADIGCGTGSWLVECLQWGTESINLFGIDLDEERIVRARDRLPQANLICGDASRLPWPDNSFDLVTQFTLFTSILSQDMKQAIAREMLRVLRPGGISIWYDFRFDNPRNPNVRGIEADEIRSLFPSCMVKLRRVTLAPQIARLTVPRSWMLALFLEKIPQLRTHYLGIITKRSILASGLEPQNRD
jgi:ubiquinone/menaquinone biosynthesis C-methylase UbiE